MGDKVVVDFHVHTNHSRDSVVSFESMVEWARKAGVDVLVVMDHDVITGAVEFRERSRAIVAAGGWAPRIIIGEEVTSSGGEICGLFLEEPVPKGLSPIETMKRIRGQGGLVYIPHPFDLLKFKRLNTHELEKLAEYIDIIEVFNGKPRVVIANLLARRFMRTHDFAQAAGSDSHEPTHIGAGRVIMDDFKGPEEMMESLRNGRIKGKLYRPYFAAWTRMRYRRIEKKEGPRILSHARLR